MRIYNPFCSVGVLVLNKALDVHTKYGSVQEKYTKGAGAGVLNVMRNDNLAKSEIQYVSLLSERRQLYMRCRNEPMCMTDNT